MTKLLGATFRPDDLLALLVALILSISGVASMLGLSLILANMSVGVALANLLPERSQKDLDIVKSFTPPMYILFFVFVGARLQVGLLPKMGGAGRTAGKMMGASVGAVVSHAPEPVKKYLGWALFSQAGMAVGLAFDIFHRLSIYGREGFEEGHMVINVITATTFLVQIIGPPSVKYAISRAWESPKPMKEGWPDGRENAC